MAELQQALSNSVFEVAKGAGDIVPGIAILVSSVQLIWAACENVRRQKAQCKQLAAFCQDVVKALNENLEGVSDVQMGKLVARMHAVLEDVLVSVKMWGHMNVWDAFTKQDRIHNSIQEKRVALADCFTVFGIASQLRLQQWNENFQRAQQEDHETLLKIASDTQSLTQLPPYSPSYREPTPPRPDPHRRQTTLSQAETPDAAMKVLQLRMRMENPGSDVYRSLQQALLDLQRATGALVPLADLDGEAKKIGPKALHYSSTYEIWEGIWLGDREERVALKCMRAPTPSEGAVRRFHRQVEIVRQLRHQHILPFYGACYVDGPSIYLVFPWQRNGDILSFLEKNKRADTMKLMLGAARGLAHLHTQAKPFVHGALQPSNILISDRGDALLADFGLAKTLEGPDAGAYTNFTISNGSQLSLRWMAPELTDGKMGTPADVYAWSMTSLQIFSGLLPFYQTKQPGRVVINVANGLRPRRDDYGGDVVLPDHIWRLLEDCWAQDPEERPRIGDVVRRVLEMRPDLARY